MCVPFPLTPVHSSPFRWILSSTPWGGAQTHSTTAYRTSLEITLNIDTLGGLGWRCLKLEGNGWKNKSPRRSDGRSSSSNSWRWRRRREDEERCVPRETAQSLRESCRKKGLPCSHFICWGKPLHWHLGLGNEVFSANLGCTCSYDLHTEYFVRSIRTLITVSRDVNLALFLEQRCGDSLVYSKHLLILQTHVSKGGCRTRAAARSDRPGPHPDMLTKLHSNVMALNHNDFLKTG